LFCSCSSPQVRYLSLAFIMVHPVGFGKSSQESGVVIFCFLFSWVVCPRQHLDTRLVLCVLPLSTRWSCCFRHFRFEEPLIPSAHQHVCGQSADLICPWTILIPCSLYTSSASFLFSTFSSSHSFDHYWLLLLPILLTTSFFWFLMPVLS
jgi:hypothetical protein